MFQIKYLGSIEGRFSNPDMDAFLETLKNQLSKGTLPQLGIAQEREDLASLETLSKAWRERFEEILILGTGGSSLGAQTLLALRQYPFANLQGLRLHCLDNVDPHTFDTLLETIDFKRTGVIAISKSGTTAETLCQFLVILEFLQSRGLSLKEHALILTEEKTSPMTKLSETFGIPMLPHHQGIGGRFSVLSNVGLLPACLGGLDIRAVRQGAENYLRDILDGKADGPLRGARMAFALNEIDGVTQMVMMPYIDRLNIFSFWYRQLWAESLGKAGKGTTPLNALGTVDQHSQVQLYLGGPRDKCYTFFTLKTEGKGPCVDGGLARRCGFEELANRTMGDLMAAEQEATIQTFARHGLPVRVFELEKLDEETMGALFMHFMIETIATAALMRIDPFDQPAVEEGKQLTRALLVQRGRLA